VRPFSEQAIEAVAGSRALGTVRGLSRHHGSGGREERRRGRRAVLRVAVVLALTGLMLLALATPAIAA
jgi:hypothetical protein